MNLVDMRPKPVEFKALGLDLVFRPFTIADDIKAQELGIIKAFKNYDFEKISLIAWYQLDTDSQKKVIKSVKAYKAYHIDPDTGDKVNNENFFSWVKKLFFKLIGKTEIEVKLRPIDKFRKLFVGHGDQAYLLTSLIKAKGLNIPDLDDEIELKKWVDQLNKEIPLTGQ